MSLATETAAITLGGESFPVRAFTLDELQLVIPHINTYQSASFAGMGAMAAATGESIAAAMQVLALALRKTVEEVGKIPATAGEVFQAVNTISTVAGLVDLGERIAAAMRMGTSSGIGSTPSLSPTAPETGSPSDA